MTCRNLNEIGLEEIYTKFPRSLFLLDESLQNSWNFDFGARKDCPWQI